MTGRCTLCGTVGPVHGHHLTGRRDPAAAYLDPVLVLDACPACHTGAGGFHPTLRAVGIDQLPAGAHLVAYRLRRVALHAVVLADAGRPLVLRPEPARGLAVLLREAAELVGAVR